jgi:hypothetical protein
MATRLATNGNAGCYEENVDNPPQKVRNKTSHNSIINPAMKRTPLVNRCV